MNPTLTPADEARAYVDGELDSDARARFEARLTHDAALADAVARERRLRDTLVSAYAPVLDEPLPEALTTLLQAPAAAPGRVVNLASARAARRAAQPAEASDGKGWWRWGGMAACLVIGLLAGLGTGRLRGPSETAAEPALASTASGMALAQGSLAQALSQQLASDPTHQGIAMGLSFQTREGAYCRTFTLAGSNATAGLACRGEQGWEVRALARAEPAGGSGPDHAERLRQAASALPAAILQAVDTLRQGDSLDAQAERAARARDWRP